MAPLQVNSKRTLIVLGMHRSGTSCLAGCLKAGLGHVATALISPANPRGHNEDPDVYTIDERLLAASGASWHTAPGALVCTEELAKRRDALVARWAAEESWRVVKDPRLCLTWPFWNEAFARAPLVGIFRHPAAVLDSFLTRGDPLPEAAVLELWLASNRQLLQVVDDRRIPLLDFEGSVSLFRKQIHAALERWEALGWRDAVKAIDRDRAEAAVTREAIHHVTTNWGDRNLPKPLMVDAQRLYGQLLQRRLVADGTAAEPTVVTPTRRDWQEHLRRALAFADAERWADAMKEFDRSAAASPDPDAIRRRAVETALKHQEGKAALALCDQSLGSTPYPRDWQLLRARSLMALERHAEVIETLDVVLAEPPILLPACRLRLQALDRQGQWSRMLETPATVPGDEAPWWVAMWRFVAQLRTGDRDAASTTYLDACANAPASALPALRHRWATTCLAVGDTVCADEVFQQMLAEPSPPIAAYMGRVRVLQCRGEHALAADLAEVACAAFPDAPWPQWTACRLARTQGDAERARAHCARAIALAPDHPETQRLVAQESRMQQSVPTNGLAPAEPLSGVESPENSGATALSTPAPALPTAACQSAPPNPDFHTVPTPSSLLAVTMLNTVNEYLHTGFRSVQGWCIPHLWQCIHPLHERQVELGLNLPVAEIGVFHGKFLIGLVKTKGLPTGNYAIDVFDLQQFNLDGAGKGNLDTFLTNLDANAVPRSAVEILRADSMALGDPEIAAIREKTPAFSLFSVDGCHLAEHTINDIRLAMRLTAPQGIIFVDDYYNASWPGVQEGVAKLYLTDSPRFVPLLCTCNKLFLCHISYHASYLRLVQESLRAHHPETTVKPVKRFGYDTLTVTPKYQSEVYLHSGESSAIRPPVTDSEPGQSNGPGIGLAPIRPRLTPEELAVLVQYAPGAHVVEFGAGGSTVAFFEMGARSVVSVESDPDWIDRVSREPSISAAKADGRWVGHFVDIGPTQDWGYPVDTLRRESWPTYHGSVWAACPTTPTLVFVDGRFRVACALQTALHAPDATILWHDFNDRPHYHAALPCFDVLGRAGSLIVLRRGQSVEDAAIAALLEQYRANPN